MRNVLLARGLSALVFVRRAFWKLVQIISRALLIWQSVLSVLFVQTCARQRQLLWCVAESSAENNGECMKQFSLVGEGVRLILKDNVLAVLSDVPLTTVSSAFHNGGGVKQTRAIVNVEVVKSCSDQCLHDDPDAYIVDSAKKFGLNENFVGMVTAAAVENFALVSKRNGALAVSVIATAADNEGNTCNYAESAGEPIDIQVHEGTINIIIVIDGNPTESCLVGTLITVTEAKMAALRELDVRSRNFR